MKKRQVILGAVAFVVTAVSALALKPNKQNLLRKILFGTWSGSQSSCTVTNCYTTSATGVPNAACQTVNSGIIPNGHNYYTTSACTAHHRYSLIRQIIN